MTFTEKNIFYKGTFTKNKREKLLVKIYFLRYNFLCEKVYVSWCRSFELLPQNILNVLLTCGLGINSYKLCAKKKRYNFFTHIIEFANLFYNENYIENLISIHLRCQLSNITPD